MFKKTMKKYLPEDIKKIGRKILKKQFSGHVERYYTKYDNDKNIDESWVGHYLIYKKMLEHAMDVPTLDLCCGSGAGTMFLLKHIKKKIFGVDYSKKALDFAKKFNSDSSIYFEKLNLNKNKDLEKLKKIILTNELKQVFFIEGIEHIKSPNKVITALKESGIKLILISTPFEPENQGIRGYHISPFTPTVYEKFSKKFNSEIICFAKSIDGKITSRQIKDGVKESEIFDKYFTKEKKDALNYLILIDNQEESISPS